MKNYSRILIAVGIFLVGAALIPFVGLPQDGFNWQRFSDAYLPMELQINYTTGRPGSFFTVVGNNFPQNDTVSILVNGVVLGSVSTDNVGSFTFLIDTTSADTGFYLITTGIVDGPEISFRLLIDAPLRPQEGEGPIFILPSGIAYQLIHLPFINK